MGDVAVVLPYVREAGAKKCIEALDRQTVRCDLFALEDTERIGVPEMVKKLVDLALASDINPPRYICFLADDTIPEPDMIERAKESMQEMGGSGLVGFNDGIHKVYPPTHWMASVDLLDHLDGEFFSTAYRHNFCDQELADRCIEMDRYVWAEKAKLEHRHPVRKFISISSAQYMGIKPITSDNFPDDEYYEWARNRYFEDRLTYWKRKRARIGFKVGIGVPIVDPQVPTDFFWSFLQIHRPHGCNLYVPKLPVGAFARHLSEARNSIVSQALMDGCSHLLMCDTDQVYPEGVLEQLLEGVQSGWDAVGASVHRRWPPFDLIMLRGEVGNYKHVPDEECYSGKIVEVDATGTGCVMFDTRCFLDLRDPWFRDAVTLNGKTVGEDIDLFARLREQGKRIAVDTSVEVGHLSTKIITRDDYEIFKLISGGSFHPPDE
jgi:hypothetical protein